MEDSSRGTWAAHNRMHGSSRDESARLVTSSRRGDISQSVLTSSPAHGEVMYRDHREYNTSARARRPSSEAGANRLGSGLGAGAMGSLPERESVVVHIDEDEGPGEHAAAAPLRLCTVPGTANAPDPGARSVPSVDRLMMDELEGNGTHEALQNGARRPATSRHGPHTPASAPASAQGDGAVELGMGSGALSRYGVGRVSGTSLDPPEEVDGKVVAPSTTEAHRRLRSDSTARTDASSGRSGDATAASTGRRKRAAKSRGPQPFAGVHVLVCDDERVNRTVLVRGGAAGAHQTCVAPPR